jgi:hypothetical protein
VGFANPEHANESVSSDSRGDIIVVAETTGDAFDRSESPVRFPYSPRPLFARAPALTPAKRRI